MKEYIDFNINHNVKVKLNKRGWDELKRQDDEMMKLFSSITVLNTPEVDEDGYCTFQMHDLMYRLGALCFMGPMPPFHSQIKIQQGN